MDTEIIFTRNKTAKQKDAKAKAHLASMLPDLARESQRQQGRPQEEQDAAAALVESVHE